MMDSDMTAKIFAVCLGLFSLFWVPFRFFFCGDLPEKYGYRWCDIKGYIKAIKARRK